MSAMLLHLCLGSYYEHCSDNILTLGHGDLYLKLELKQMKCSRGQNYARQWQTSQQCAGLGGGV